MFRSNEIDCGWYVDNGLADERQPGCYVDKSTRSRQGELIIFKLHMVAYLQ